MLDNCTAARLVANLDRDNAVIELLWRGPIWTYVIRISGIDTYRERRNAYRLEHCSHEIGFIFAIAIRLCKNFGSGVWTIAPSAAQTGLNRDVLNILDVLADCLNLLVFRFGGNRKLHRLRGERIVDSHLWIFQFAHPGANFRPIRESLNLGRRPTRGRVIADC